MRVWLSACLWAASLLGSAAPSDASLASGDNSIGSGSPQNGLHDFQNVTELAHPRAPRSPDLSLVPRPLDRAHLMGRPSSSVLQRAFRWGIHVRGTGWPPPVPTHPPGHTNQPWWTTNGPPRTTTPIPPWLVFDEPTQPTTPKTPATTRRTTSWWSPPPTTTTRRTTFSQWWTPPQTTTRAPTTRWTPPPTTTRAPTTRRTTTTTTPPPTTQSPVASGPGVLSAVCAGRFRSAALAGTVRQHRSVRRPVLIAFGSERDEEHISSVSPSSDDVRLMSRGRASSRLLRQNNVIYSANTSSHNVNENSVYRPNDSQSLRNGHRLRSERVLQSRISQRDRARGLPSAQRVSDSAVKRIENASARRRYRGEESSVDEPVATPSVVGAGRGSRRLRFRPNMIRHNSVSPSLRRAEESEEVPASTDPWQSTIRRLYQEHVKPQPEGVDGKIDQDFRIVGGRPSAAHSYPWLVALFHGSKQFCGGSLIDDRHILTAAHCVAKLTQAQMSSLRVVLGAHDLRRQDVGSTVSLTVGNVVYHKGYDANKLINDIAILTLSSRVTFSGKVKPICLNGDPAVPAVGEYTRVAGWGSLREGLPQEKLPQEVDLFVWSNPQCGQRFGRIAPAGVVDSYLCAGRDGKDSCMGDSGGPQIMQHRGVWTQVGVVSWGIGCGQGQFPGVYSRMSHFLPWVEEVIQKF